MLAGFSQPSVMMRILGKSGLLQFRHRVALQMSEDDSFTYIQGRQASLLQKDGPQPIVGFYKDMNGGRQTRFKPYCVDDAATWATQMAFISSKLKQRNKK